MTSERDPEPRSEATTTAVRLATVLPEIAAVIPEEDRLLAERVLLAPRLAAPSGDLAATLAQDDGSFFDFIVIEGVVLKETTLATRSALEILGPGDVLTPPLSAARQLDSRAVSRYLAHGPVSLAGLDARFRQAARRWPGLSDALYDRLAQQSHRASMHLAMLHLPRVEERVVALFSDLAERFGRMTPDGILIEVPLTHEVIGRLVGSRRPTVSLALQSLATDGVLIRLADDRWQLAPTAVSP